MHAYLMTWHQIAANLRDQAAGPILRVEKHRVPNPRDAGMTISWGLPLGQAMDYRMPFPDCGRLHVRDFGNHYEAHLDRKNPNCDLVGHTVQDAPVIAGGIALGILAGLALGRSKDATLVGALIGGALGVLVATTDEGKRRQNA